MKKEVEGKEERSTSVHRRERSTNEEGSGGKRGKEREGVRFRKALETTTFYKRRTAKV